MGNIIYEITEGLIILCNIKANLSAISGEIGSFTKEVRSNKGSH